MLCIAFSLFFFIFDFSLFFCAIKFFVVFKDLHELAQQCNVPLIFRAQLLANTHLNECVPYLPFVRVTVRIRPACRGTTIQRFFESRQKIVTKLLVCLVLRHVGIVHHLYLDAAPVRASLSCLPCIPAAHSEGACRLAW